MPFEVILPKVDMDMTHARIAQWYFTEGQRVSKGDVLFDMETDKSMMDVEAPATGTLAHVSEVVDAEISVGEVVAWIYAEGETVAEITANPQTATTATTATTAHDQPVPTELSPPVAHESTDTAQQSVRASPFARKLARDNAIDLKNVSGSGPMGRIVATDIIVRAPSQQPTRAIEALQHPTSDASVENLFAEDAFSRLPHNAMRRAIATRVSLACSTVPAYHLSVDCEIDALLALRKDLPVTDRKKPSINDCIVKALALALHDNPQANASWTDTAMLVHKTVDIGVAVALDDGLITPLIRSAQSLSLHDISTEIQRLADKARRNALTPDEYRGGTTTVSNLGMFGADRFTSIINPPHSSIVSIGAASERAVVREGIIEIATVLTATFAFDHRVIDGALGAQLASCFRQCIENPQALIDP